MQVQGVVNATYTLLPMEYHPLLDSRLGGPESWYGCCAQERNLCLYRYPSHESSVFQPVTLSLCSRSYTGSRRVWIRIFVMTFWWDMRLSWRWIWVMTPCSLGTGYRLLGQTFCFRLMLSTDASKNPPAPSSGCYRRCGRTCWLNIME